MAKTIRSDLNLLLAGLYSDKDLIRKFEVYAQRLLYKRTKNEFALHLCPSDFVASVTLKLLNGIINWDEEQCSLSCFYFRRIRTDVINLTRRESKFIPTPLEKSSVINDYTGESDDNLFEPPELIINPFEDNDDNGQFDPVEFKEAALEIFKDSVEAYCVFDEMLKGLKPKEIARSLGLTENKVYYLNRHIKRILKEKLNPINNPGESTPDNNNNGELI
jgi:DNA-directed RNA polymerase specialized sigma24 family protein